MKNIFLLVSILAISITVVNCSKDDDKTPVIDTSSLYGVWNLDYFIENGQLVEDISCNKKVTYVFLSDGKYSKTTYAGEGSTNCATAVVIYGVWEGLGDNLYQLSPNGSSVSENLNISFQDNFTKFTIVYSSSYTEVYTKQ